VRDPRLKIEMFIRLFVSSFVILYRTVDINAFIGISRYPFSTRPEQIAIVPSGQQPSLLPDLVFTSKPLKIYQFTRPSYLLAKKKGNSGNNYKSGARGQQPQQEKKSVQDARLDAATRQFMFTMLNLSKVLPDKSKTILKNINLCFYPGAKIGKSQ